MVKIVQIKGVLPSLVNTAGPRVSEIIGTDLISYV